MVSVKILGAGSIGNHLAHASRRLGWEVVVCDVSEQALERMRHQIYPGRYGAWDPSIRLFHSDSAPTGGFDLIHIGTPPEHHIPLALRALKEAPKAILVEKPLCLPSLEGADDLYRAAQNSPTRVYVGYDHVVGKAARETERLILSGAIGSIETLDVEFREHWEGIFKAHPWLSGPADSYLGFWKRGGGASGEHSHAINLWQHLSHLSGGGRVREVDGRVRYRTEGNALYDSLCFLTLTTEHGLCGRVVQDIVTRPARKRARLQGSKGAIEWINGFNPSGDAVLHTQPDGTEERHLVSKTRPDDFIEELKHLQEHWASRTESSGIALTRGLDTMLVVASAHLAEESGCRIRIDYSKGYSTTALQPAGKG